MLARVIAILGDVGNKVERACLVRIAARLGILRLLDPLGLRKLPTDTAARTIAIMYRVEPMVTVCEMLRGIPKSAQELDVAPPLEPDVPLVVLSHERPEGLLPPGYESEVEAFEPEWRDVQQRLARRSTRGTWRMVPNSGHLIHASQPHAVAGAVLEMLAQVRRGH
jgi:pimeloyl-ACP methyl ester carboxylesterase